MQDSVTIQLFLVRQSFDISITLDISHKNPPTAFFLWRANPWPSLRSSSYSSVDGRTELFLRAKNVQFLLSFLISLAVLAKVNQNVRIVFCFPVDFCLGCRTGKGSEKEKVQPLNLVKTLPIYSAHCTSEVIFSRF